MLSLDTGPSNDSSDTFIDTSRPSIYGVAKKSSQHAS